MFSRLSPVAALALASWANALLLEIPVNWHSSSVVNISWTNTPTDPPFTLQLAREIFHDTFSIASNLNPSADFATFQLGVVPSGQYTLRAINVTNANQIYDQTPSFEIQDPPATTSTSTSTSTSTNAQSNSTQTSGSGSSTATVPASPGTTTTPFGTTKSPSETTGTPSSDTSASSDSASASGGAAGAQPSGFNGAASIPRLTPYAVAALALVAGAAAAL